MENVKALVARFHSQKGIWPLDEEVLIQFELLQPYRVKTSIDSIAEHFLEARRELQNAKKERQKSATRKASTFEPARNLTGDERILYTFLFNYCKDRDLNEQWVADWGHVRDSTTDEDIERLIVSYTKGEIGTIPLRNPSIGGDRVLSSFRIYSCLDETDRWDKFFCAGLSDDELFRIMITRHACSEERMEQVSSQRNPELENRRGESKSYTRPQSTECAVINSNIFKKKLDENVKGKNRRPNSTPKTHTMKSGNKPGQASRSDSHHHIKRPTARPRESLLDFTEITMTVQTSLARPRVCAEWLETGNCSLGKLCPDYHS